MGGGLKKICPRCGVEFKAVGRNRFKQIFCSRACWHKDYCNREEVRKLQRERANNRYSINRDSVMKASIKYRLKNRATCSERTKKWQRENYGKNKAIKFARVARLKNAFVSYANKVKIAKIYEEAKRISKETGILHHVDHIIPMKGKYVTGLHHEGNLQIIPATENLRKYNKVNH